MFRNRFYAHRIVRSLVLTAVVAMLVLAPLIVSPKTAHAQGQQQWANSIRALHSVCVVLDRIHDFRAGQCWQVYVQQEYMFWRTYGYMA